MYAIIYYSILFWRHVSKPKLKVWPSPKPRLISQMGRELPAFFANDSININCSSLQKRRKHGHQLGVVRIEVGGRHRQPSCGQLEAIMLGAKVSFKNRNPKLQDCKKQQPLLRPPPFKYTEQPPLSSWFIKKNLVRFLLHRSLASMTATAPWWKR